VRGLFTIVLFAGMTGCATTVTPPARIDDPATVFIADYGRHASLILPDDTDGANLVEFTTGDWCYFAMHRVHPLSVARALLLPTQTTLGRRYYDEAPQTYHTRHTKTPPKRIVPLEVDGQSVNVLTQYLNRIYSDHTESETYNPNRQFHFVKTDAPYNLFSNSNHDVAKWLRELDCTVHGPAILSNFQVDKE